MSEEKRIMDYLGRGTQEGDVKGSHLGKILTYLKMTKSESVRKTLSKLTLICGTGQRYIRENYLEGLEEFGVLSVQSNGRDIIWTWVGVKAFDGKLDLSEIIEPSKQKTEIEKEMEKHKDSKTPFTDAVKELE